MPWPNARWLRAFSRCEVDVLGVLEHRLVAVGGAEQQQQVGALRQVRPRTTVAGAFVLRFQANTGVDDAQHLLDRRRDQRGVAAQLRPALGLCEQHPEPLAQQRRRRLVPGEQLGVDSPAISSFEIDSSPSR